MLISSQARALAQLESEDEQQPPADRCNLATSDQAEADDAGASDRRVQPNSAVFWSLSGTRLPVVGLFGMPCLSLACQACTPEEVFPDGALCDCCSDLAQGLSRQVQRRLPLVAEHTSSDVSEQLHASSGAEQQSSAKRRGSGGDAAGHSIYATRAKQPRAPSTDSVAQQPQQFEAVPQASQQHQTEKQQLMQPQPRQSELTGPGADAQHAVAAAAAVAHQDEAQGDSQEIALWASQPHQQVPAFAEAPQAAQHSGLPDAAANTILPDAAAAQGEVPANVPAAEMPGFQTPEPGRPTCNDAGVQVFLVLQTT